MNIEENAELYDLVKTIRIRTIHMEQLHSFEAKLNQWK